MPNTGEDVKHLGHIKALLQQQLLLLPPKAALLPSLLAGHIPQQAYNPVSSMLGSCRLDAEHEQGGGKGRRQASGSPQGAAVAAEAATLLHPASAGLLC